jgi:adenine deaminase
MSPSVESIKTLIDVAMGRKHADIVIRRGTWVCVQSGELIPDTVVAIKDGRIAYVGTDVSRTISRDTVVIDADNKYLVPGLLDAHMHVESSMLTVTEFVRAALPHGTTGMFIDPHEIANIFGLKGVKLMVEEALRQPIHVHVEVPSCVPSAFGMETPGGEITPGDVAEALTWEGIIGLGEVMNYPGVAAGDEKILAEISATRRAGKTISGHYASPDLGRAFHAYAAGGAEDDHEGTRIEDAVARVRQGMKAILRQGSAWHDVASQVGAITKLGLDSRHFLLCTDDSHAETLLSEGHMDRVVRFAIAQGLEPMAAIQMATINTAEHFGVAREIGSIAPGRWADILMVDDLKEFRVELVIARGRIAAENGVMQFNLPVVHYPDWAMNSVHLPRLLTAEDFKLRVTNQAKNVKVNVIGIVENQAPTKHLTFDMQPVGGEIKADPKRDLAKLAVIERHHGTGNVQVGLVTGFKFTEHCAIASTVAHDSHHVIVVGTNEEDMAVAVNKLVEAGGGQVVVNQGKVIGMIELPLGGLMSIERADRVAKKAASVLSGFHQIGCELNNPNMTMSLLALPVIPELRLTDKGLVDVINFRFIPVIEGNEK